MPSGCSREKAPEPAQKPPSYAPESYMKDPAFRRQLKHQRSAAKALLAKRFKLTDQIAAERAKKPVDEKLIKRLEEDVAAIDAAVATNRIQTYNIVRQRITPPGGAKAKSAKDAKKTAPAK